MTPRTCATKGCERLARQRRKLCSACSHAIRRYGDPLHRQERSGKGKGQQLLRELLAIESDECILWPLYLTKGYGYVAHEGRRSVGVHVIACTQRYGAAPTAEHEVAHGCGQRACVNYRHLRWATRTENMADAIEHGTTARGERRPGHRLRGIDVIRIRRTYVGRRGQIAQLAREYGVAESTIHDVITRRTWAWLEEAS